MQMMVEATGDSNENVIVILMIVKVSVVETRRVNKDMVTLL